MGNCFLLWVLPSPLEPLFCCLPFINLTLFPSVLHSKCYHPITQRANLPTNCSLCDCFFEQQGSLRMKFFPWNSGMQIKTTFQMWVLSCLEPTETEVTFLVFSHFDPCLLHCLLPPPDMGVQITLWVYLNSVALWLSVDHRTDTRASVYIEPMCPCLYETWYKPLVHAGIRRRWLSCLWISSLLEFSVEIQWH